MSLECDSPALSLTEKRQLRTRRVAKSLASVATAAAIMLVPGSETRPIPYEAPEATTIWCPPRSQFGVFNVPGLGMRTIGLYASEVTHVILGDTYDACIGGLDMGTHYDVQKNTDALEGYIENNKLKAVVGFAHSFGGIAFVDMVNEYMHRHPDTDTKFAIAFFSSPDSFNTLHTPTRVGAELYSALPVVEELVYAQNYIGIGLQGEHAWFSPELKELANENASKTPPTLLHSQAKRLREGMSTLNEHANVALYAVIDVNDSVVDVVSAVSGIESATGRSIQEVIHIRYPDQRLAAHSGLWWLPYAQVHGPAVLEVTRRASQDLGFKLRYTAPVLGRAALTKKPA